MPVPFDQIQEKPKILLILLLNIWGLITKEETILIKYLGLDLAAVQ
jgi:hypothetical protein